MQSTIAEPAVRITGHSIHTIFAAFPMACFCGALATDTAYALTSDMIWADFSAWLLAVGVIMGVLAAIAGIFDFIANRRLIQRRPAWLHSLGNLVVLALAVLDNLVHSRDAWTSVVPFGLLLSAVIVVVMLLTAWSGGSMVYVRSLNGQPVGVRV